MAVGKDLCLAKLVVILAPCLKLFHLPCKMEAIRQLKKRQKVINMKWCQVASISYKALPVEERLHVS